MAANIELLLKGVPMDKLSQVRASIEAPELMAVKSNVIMNPSQNMTYNGLYLYVRD